MEHDCIFCKIVRGELPSARVYEDSEWLGFLDIHPVNKGHTLLIPKTHFPYITDTPQEVVGRAFIRARHIMPYLKEVLGAQVIALTVMGIDVPHFHIHLIPRFDNDGLAGFWPARSYDSQEEMISLRERISSHIPPFIQEH